MNKAIGRGLVGALVAVTAIGCGTSAAPKAGGGSGSAVVPSTGKGSGSGSAAVAATGSGSATRKAPVVAITEQAAMDALAAWGRAQNSGDFAAYQALFADKFEGVRRSGPRVRRFDRAGWMTDRKRMFDKPMEVSTSTPTFGLHGAVATLDFEQTFKQGTYKDVGAKRVVMVADASGIKIAREEMLASNLVGTPVGAPVQLVTSVSTTPMVILEPTADRAWGSGAITRVPSEGPLLASQAATALPPAQAAWVGKALAGYAVDGTPCAATVKDVVLLVGATPHFSTTMGWDDPEFNSLGRALTEQERADDIFDWADPVLAARFEASCTPAFFTTDKPTFFAELKASPLADQGLAAFAKLPEFVALQQEFAAGGGQGAWTTPDEAKVFALPAGEHLVAVAAEEAVGGCGDFSGALWALWKVNAKGAWIKLVAEQTLVMPDAVFDLTGDGSYELYEAAHGFSTFERVQRAADGAMPAAVTFSFNDCGC